MPRVLYHTILCPFSRKVRLLLDEQKITYVGREEKHNQPSPEFLKINPAGMGPVLVDENIAVVQDYAICEYLQEVYGPNFLGITPVIRTETRRLVTWFDVKFYQEVTNNLVYEKITRRICGHGVPDSNALRRGREMVRDHLAYISWLIDRRRWLAGNDFSLADITAAAHISCVDYSGDVLWDKYPIAKGWYMRLKSRPTFRNFLAETIFGVPPCSHYRLLDF